jgi:uncharacterized protein (DUF58 family)
MPGMNPSAAVEERRSFASPPSGYLLHKASLMILAGMLFLAAWRGQAGLVILLGLVVSAAGLAGLWSRVALAGVRARRSVRESRLFPGESTEVTLEIFNRKPLPLPWIKVDDEIPEKLAGNGSSAPDHRPGYRLLTRSASILWYRKASWKYPLRAERRGYYRLGPLTVTSGDIFGFYPRWASFPTADSILVYPRIFPIEQLEVPSLHPMGDARTSRRIFQDPTRAIGLRDYGPRDSLKYIHWKASARRQQLQVKVFEPTTTLKVSLFLAADGFAPDGPRGEEEFELAVSAAASIAYHLIDRGAQVGLVSNACMEDSGQAIQIPAGGSDDQLMEILETLAKVTPRFKDSAEVFWQGESKSLPSGTTLILIASRVPDSLRWLLRDWKESGSPVLLLLTGDRREGGGDGFLPICSIRHPGSLLRIHPEAPG